MAGTTGIEPLTPLMSMSIEWPKLRLEKRRSNLNDHLAGACLFDLLSQPNLTAPSQRRGRLKRTPGPTCNSLHSIAAPCLPMHVHAGTQSQDPPMFAPLRNNLASARKRPETSCHRQLWTVFKRPSAAQAEGSGRTLRARSLRRSTAATTGGAGDFGELLFARSTRSTSPSSSTLTPP